MDRADEITRLDGRWPIDDHAPRHAYRHHRVPAWHLRRGWVCDRCGGGTVGDHAPAPVRWWRWLRRKRKGVPPLPARGTIVHHRDAPETIDLDPQHPEHGAQVGWGRVMHTWYHGETDQLLCDVVFCRPFKGFEKVGTGVWTWRWEDIDKVLPSRMIFGDSTLTPEDEEAEAARAAERNREPGAG